MPWKVKNFILISVMFIPVALVMLAKHVEGPTGSHSGVLQKRLLEECCLLTSFTRVALRMTHVLPIHHQTLKKFERRGPG